LGSELFSIEREINRARISGSDDDEISPGDRALFASRKGVREEYLAVCSDGNPGVLSGLEEDSELSRLDGRLRGCGVSCRRHR